MFQYSRADRRTASIIVFDWPSAQNDPRLQAYFTPLLESSSEFSRIPRAWDAIMGKVYWGPKREVVIELRRNYRRALSH